MIALLTFAIGVAGLLIAANLVVAGSSQLGLILGLTPTIIGLTIVAAGTSAPELAVVSQAVANGDSELAVGSIIGSNIANVLLVLGLVAATGAITVSNRVVRVDIPIMVVASGALLVLSLDNRISRLDGLFLFLGVVVFVTWTIRATRRVNAASVRSDVVPARGRAERLRPSWRDLLALVAGVALLAVASGYVVSGAERIAAALGVPELIVGLTIVALGTSSPEIVTTIIAAVGGRRELAVGNAVGSNIFNILLVLGLSGAIAPDGIAIGPDAVTLDLPIMLAAAFACVPMVLWDNRLERWEGIGMSSPGSWRRKGPHILGTGHRASDPFAFVMMAFVVPLTVITLVAVILARRRRSRGQEILIEQNA